MEGWGKERWWGEERLFSPLSHMKSNKELQRLESNKELVGREKRREEKGRRGEGREERNDEKILIKFRRHYTLHHKIRRRYHGYELKTREKYSGANFYFIVYLLFFIVITVGFKTRPTTTIPKPTTTPTPFTTKFTTAKFTT